MAAKPQLACFERLGAPGWAALERVIDAAQEAGLLVIADGKRGDVPVSASAYAQALFGSTPSPFGTVPGLGADAATLNGTLGRDSLEPLIEGAGNAGAGLFVLVRTSNPGASDLLDQPTPDVPFHERLAAMVADLGPRLEGREGLSGLGAVVGATAPGHIARLRELMPAAPFLLPGVGAQGGSAAGPRARFRLAPGVRDRHRVSLHRRGATTRQQPPKPFAKRFGTWLAGLSTPARPTMKQGYDRREHWGTRIRWQARPDFHPRSDGVRSSLGSPPCSRWRRAGSRSICVVMSFTENGGGDSKNDKKNRSEQSKDEKQASTQPSYTVAAGDTLSAIAVETGVPEPRIERLNPEIDAETLNAGQILALR